MYVTSCKRFSYGNVPYELSLKNYSEIEEVGVFSINANSLKSIKFEEIKKHNGFISKYIT